jgi:hypothetical protein
VLCVGAHDIIRNSCETFKDADLAEDLEIERNRKKYKFRAALHLAEPSRNKSKQDL